MWRGGTGILLKNVHNISIEGLETLGGTYAVEYVSTPEAGKQALSNISIRNCIVHGVRGEHGICVYARNDLAPVTNLTIEGCEVYDCECYWRRVYGHQRQYRRISDPGKQKSMITTTSGLT